MMNEEVKTENLRRGVYILPNLVTAASLFAAFHSLMLTSNGQYKSAAIWIFISAICDGLDGKIARMTGTSSKFGVEFDSLVDVMAFGLIPAFLAYSWALKPFGRIGWLAAVLFATCGAIRLARFNIQVNVVKSTRFVGLPIPAAGCMIASVVLISQTYLTNLDFYLRLGVLILVLLLAFLMVSTVSYYSFKDPALIKRQPLGVFIFAIILLLLLWAEPIIMIFTVMITYIMIGFLISIVTIPKRRKEKLSNN